MLITLSVVRIKQDSDFNNNYLTNKNSITLKKQAENDNEVITKAYVDKFHQENERSRRDFGSAFYDRSNDLVRDNQDSDLNDNKLTNLVSITVKRNPISVNELSTKKYIDDQLDKNTILGCNQTLENYLKVIAGNDTYNLTKDDKIQIADTTMIKAGYTGGYSLPGWRTFISDKINNGKIQNFIKSTKTKFRSSENGTTSLPPICDSYMCRETSSINHGNKVFVSFEQTDIIQISNITFADNRFSILTIDSLKSMGRFRIQLLLQDDTWSTRYNLPKSDRHSDTFNWLDSCKSKFYWKKLRY